MLHEIDLSRVDLNLLVLFDVVLQTRHVGRAAERLNLSPSAVSHGLGRLRGLLDDPLFLRTPRGVTPTDRALQLAPVVADILSRVREVVATARPFDPASSTRRFTIGAPDGASAVFLPPLRAAVEAAAPAVDLAVRQLLPRPGETANDQAWREGLASLEAGALDAIVIPTAEAPARFAVHALYDEDFVVAMRKGHAFATRLTLDAYCAQRHLVVSETGDAYGFVDAALARQGRSRRVALTVPNFMLAMAMVADGDLIAAVPRRLALMHGPRLGVGFAEAPLPLPRFQLCLVTPKVALRDAGLAWLAAIIARPVALTSASGS